MLGSPYFLFVQKLWLIVELLTAHHLTSLDVFLVGLHILYAFFVYTPKIMMFQSLPPPKWVVPIVSIVATDNVQACGKHRFGCSNTLVSAWNVRYFGGSLRRPRNGAR